MSKPDAVRLAVFVDVDGEALPAGTAHVREAAGSQQQDVTSFVLGAATERAREVLLKDKVLRLSPEGMQQIEAALDAEVEVVPELAALLHSVRSARLSGGARTPANA